MSRVLIFHGQLAKKSDLTKSAFGWSRPLFQNLHFY